MPSKRSSSKKEKLKLGGEKQPEEQFGGVMPKAWQDFLNGYLNPARVHTQAFYHKPRGVRHYDIYGAVMVNGIAYVDDGAATPLGFQFEFDIGFLERFSLGTLQSVHDIFGGSLSAFILLSFGIGVCDALRHALRKQRENDPRFYLKNILNGHPTLKAWYRFLSPLDRRKYVSEIYQKVFQRDVFQQFSVPKYLVNVEGATALNGLDDLVVTFAVNPEWKKLKQKMPELKANTILEAKQALPLLKASHKLNWLEKLLGWRYEAQTWSLLKQLLRGSKKKTRGDTFKKLLQQLSMAIVESWKLVTGLIVFFALTYWIGGMTSELLTTVSALNIPIAAPWQLLLFSVAMLALLLVIKLGVQLKKQHVQLELNEKIKRHNRTLKNNVEKKDNKSSVQAKHADVETWIADAAKIRSSVALEMHNTALQMKPWLKYMQLQRLVALIKKEAPKEKNVLKTGWEEQITQLRSEARSQEETTAPTTLVTDRYDYKKVSNKSFFPKLKELFVRAALGFVSGFSTVLLVAGCLWGILGYTNVNLFVVNAAGNAMFLLHPIAVTVLCCAIGIGLFFAAKAWTAESRSQKLRAQKLRELNATHTVTAQNFKGSLQTVYDEYKGSVEELMEEVNSSLLDQEVKDNEEMNTVDQLQTALTGIINSYLPLAKTDDQKNCLRELILIASYKSTENKLERLRQGEHSVNRLKRKIKDAQQSLVRWLKVNKPEIKQYNEEARSHNKHVNPTEKHPLVDFDPLFEKDPIQPISRRDKDGSIDNQQALETQHFLQGPRFSWSFTRWDVAQAWWKKIKEADKDFFFWAKMVCTLGLYSVHHIPSPVRMRWWIKFKHFAGKLRFLLSGIGSGSLLMRAMAGVGGLGAIAVGGVGLVTAEFLPALLPMQTVFWAALALGFLIFFARVYVSQTDKKNQRFDQSIDQIDAQIEAQEQEEKYLLGKLAYMNAYQEAFDVESQKQSNDLLVREDNRILSELAKTIPVPSNVTSVIATVPLFIPAKPKSDVELYQQLSVILFCRACLLKKYDETVIDKVHPNFKEMQFNQNELARCLMTGKGMVEEALANLTQAVYDNWIENGSKGLQGIIEEFISGKIADGELSLDKECMKEDEMLGKYREYMEGQCKTGVAA